MNRTTLAVVGCFCCALSIVPALGAAQDGIRAGESSFAKHCAMCHPDGGNIINPAKTLNRKSLEGNNVRNSQDIVGKMRNPGPGMARFDDKTVGDSEARAIADYILRAFR